MKTSGNINSLPIELLSQIFSLVIHSEDAQADRCRLVLVCRLWREHVEGSALLWTDISAQGSKTYIHRALQRSKASAINLQYNAYNTAHTNLETFMAEAGPHIARWRSLTVEVEFHPLSWGSALVPLTMTQAPILERLELRRLGSDRYDFRNPITLFGGAPAPPTFKRLTLQCVQVVIETLNLSGLISLDLDTVANISTLQLLQILRNSPSLETLSLSGVAGIRSQPSIIPFVELPKLVSLTLDLLDCGGANCILSTIRIPNRRRVHICQDVNDQPDLFTPTITHILCTSSPTPDPKSFDIEVEVGDSVSCLIRFRGMELELYMDVEDQMQGVLGWLVEGLGSEAAGCSVRLMIDPSDVDVGRLVAVPSPLFVKHLSIPARSFGSLLQASRVATLQPAEPESSGWLLAQMESLSIEFDIIESQQEFISMLRSRHGEASDKAELTCPMNLKSVELRGRPRAEGLVEEITDIIGEVDVFWHDCYRNVRV